MLRDDSCWNNTVATEESVYGSTATLEERLDRIGRSINSLGDEINQLYEMFDVSLINILSIILVFE